MIVDARQPVRDGKSFQCMRLALEGPIDARVGQRLGSDIGGHPAEPELIGVEPPPGLGRSKEQDAQEVPAHEDGNEEHGREAQTADERANRLEKAVPVDVRDVQDFPGLHHAAELRVFPEVDFEVPDLRILGRRDDGGLSRPRGNLDDRAAAGLGDKDDLPRDGMKDGVGIERGDGGVRHLEERPQVGVLDLERPEECAGRQLGGCPFLRLRKHHFHPSGFYQPRSRKPMVFGSR